MATDKKKGKDAPITRADSAAVWAELKESRAWSQRVAPMIEANLSEIAEEILDVKCENIDEAMKLNYLKGYYRGLKNLIRDINSAADQAENIGMLGADEEDFSEPGVYGSEHQAKRGHT